MSFASKAPRREKALDEEVRRLAKESLEEHFPSRPSYGRSGGRGIAKWACAGCDYWAGYNSRTKSNRMILAHVTQRNTEPGPKIYIEVESGVRYTQSEVTKLHDASHCWRGLRLLFPEEME